MAYHDWSPEHQFVWDFNFGDYAREHMDSYDREWAQELYEVGLTSHLGEEDPNVIAEARELLFDLFSMDEADFEWEDWREAMGY